MPIQTGVYARTTLCVYLLAALAAATPVHAQSSPQALPPSSLPNAPSPQLATLQPIPATSLAAEIAAFNDTPIAPTTQSEDPAQTPTEDSAEGPQTYNLHAQYTFTGMGSPGFSAKYSTPAYMVYGTGRSLPTQGQARETQ